MAANRQNVPLRAVGDNFALADGTMCRMPSPLPGPLRTEREHELLDLKSTLDGATGILLRLTQGPVAWSGGLTSSACRFVSGQHEKVA